MKITRFLSVIALALLTLSAVSCNKEPEPIVLTGTWNIDTTQTKVFIKYDELKAQENPVAFNFLKDNVQKIRKNLIQPDQIIFSGTNSVVFKLPSGTSVEGTYVQLDNVYFQINISLFPEGIVCGSDNRNLEIYYPRDYVMGVISSILTPNDPPYSIFNEMVTDESGGIALFRR